MNDLPLISVAMPVYNAGEHLSEAIESILAQTFVNYEFIIIDDGSTDNSLQVLREYEKRDKRIRLISRENRNLATTLNDIITLARGRWIARMDQDDIALSNRFEVQLAWLEKSGADICGSWVQFFGSSEGRIVKYSQTNEAIKMELLFGSPFAHPTVMMRTGLVKALGYDKEWEKCEDYDLWVRAAQQGWVMSNVPEVLLLYRQHDSQISATSSKQQQLTQKVRHRYWLFVFDSLGLNKIWIDEVLKLRESFPDSVQMDYVDSALNALLSETSDDARATVFDHATRLYFRAAATCPDVVKRWAVLNESYGKNFGIYTKTRLWMLRRFRIHPDSVIFKNLKKWYFYFSCSK